MAIRRFFPVVLFLILLANTAWTQRLALSPDGKLLAGGRKDKTAKLWDAATGKVVRSLAGHGSEVNAVAFSPDGRWLASASGDKTVKLWDVATGQEQRTLSGHKDLVVAVGFSPDGKLLASSGFDKTIKLWDAASGRELRTMSGHKEQVQTVAFSPDSRRLASGSWDRLVKLWEVETGRELRTLIRYTDPKTKFGTVHAGVYFVIFSPDGSLLAAANNDNSVKLVEVETGRELRTLRGHGELEIDVPGLMISLPGVLSIAFTPDGKWLASGGRDKTIKLWDAANGQELRTMKHDAVVNALVFSADGKRLASSGEDDSVKLWDPATGQQVWP